MGFWAGILIGIFVGMFFGIMIVALCSANDYNNSDEYVMKKIAESKENGI